MKHYTTTAAILLTAALTVSCHSSKKLQNPNNPSTDNTVVVTPSNSTDMDEAYLTLSDAQRDIVNRNNVFALQLFNQVSDHSSKVVSPLSVAYLMGMLANGADGVSQQEILKAIGCEGIDINDLNSLYQNILQTADRLDQQTTVSIANYIAVNKAYRLRPQFVSTVTDHYMAGVESLDFSNPATVKHINNWCSKHTDGMIPSIIDQTDPAAVSYLMNAIYFKGTWQNKFNAKDTKLENFRGYTRDIQKVEMMHQIKKLFYAENKDFKAVDLPYGNGSYRMLVLLPNEGKNIQEIMKGLDEEKLNQISQNMENCMVNLKLPRFTIEQELPLNAIISDLGAPSMFVAGKANFSHFADGNFFVSKMLQKAKIEVNEQGTKAAAVTAAVMLTAMAPEETRNVEFIADRPFVYMIQDSQSGGILFMGQYCGTH